MSLEELEKEFKRQKQKINILFHSRKMKKLWKIKEKELSI